MRKTRRLLSALLVPILAYTLCACGGGSTAPSPESTAAKAESATAAEKTESVTTSAETDSLAAQDISEASEKTESKTEVKLPIEGEYTVFAVLNQDSLVEAKGLELDSVLTLDENGTGSMTMNEDKMQIASWSAEGDVVTITMEDESTANAAVKNGILELDLYGDGSMIWYFAQENADISGYSTMTLEEYQESKTPKSRLYAFWNSLDPVAGIHLSYNMHTDYLDSDQSFEVHEKDAVYYSKRITKVSGSEGVNVTFSKDGKVYHLDPEKKTGSVVTTVSANSADKIIQMDKLFSNITIYSKRLDCTEETRELDGVSYTVEVFPETEYTPEVAFYFDDDGKLVYSHEAAPVVETTADIGETTFTIHAIDDKVDEHLLDVSDYELTE